MRIPPELRQEIVEHALRDAPVECCGLVAIRDGVAETVHPVTNVKASPFLFVMDPVEQLRAITAIEDSGAEFASYHSHTRSAPEPSQTDINMAKDWPGMEWIIIGTKSAEPEVRSWLIDGGKVTEVPIT